MIISSQFSRDAQVLNIILPDRSVMATGAGSLVRQVYGDTIVADTYGSWHPQKFASEIWYEALDANITRYQVVRVFAFGHGDQIAREINSIARIDLGDKLEIYTMAPIYDKHCLNHARLSDLIKLRQWNRKRQGRYSVRNYAKAVILPQGTRINTAWQMIHYLQKLFRFNDRKERSQKLYFTVRSDITDYLYVLRKLGALQRPFRYITLMPTAAN